MSDKSNNQDQYDPAKSRNYAVLRVAASAYLVYLGYGLLKGAVTGAEGQVPLQWLIGILFMAVGIAFAVYAWKSYRKETGLPETEEETENNETPEEGP